MSQLYVDNIKGRTGGAVGFPTGMVVTGVSTFNNAVSIAGTLTYDDVTNVDAVGLITARSGVKVTGGEVLVGTAFSVSQAGVVTCAGIKVTDGEVLVGTAFSVSQAGVVTCTGVNVVSGGIDITAGGLDITAGGLNVTGVTTFSNEIEVEGVVETVAAAATFMGADNKVGLELDLQSSTVFTHTQPGSGNLGIVSFKNLPVDSQGGSTVTLLITQASSTPVAFGNTTVDAGIGTNCTVIPFAAGASIAGISTAAKVGSATTIVLSETANDVDFVSFFVHYNGGTNTDPASYKVYATKNGGFRFGNVGV